MMPALKVERAGPLVTVQDAGWRGTLATGLSAGGAADTRALAEIWALLGEPNTAVLEMAGMGGQFRALAPMRIAFSGAMMSATLDGAPMLWNAVHKVEAGQVLDIGAAHKGTYGYLGIGGGLKTPRFLGSSSTHRTAGLGQVVQAGDILAIGTDTQPDRIGLALPHRAQNNDLIQVVQTAHTALFSEELIDRFEKAMFLRGARGNRQGISLETDQNFSLEGGQSIPSETVIAGDIQVPGQGVLFALLADCQTTGGYPRIAAILPSELPKIAQANVGDAFQFKFMDREKAVAVELAERAARAALANKCRPILRDPAKMNDLLSYQLISGAIAST